MRTPLVLTLPLLIAACGGPSNRGLFDEPVDGVDASADASGQADAADKDAAAPSDASASTDAASKDSSTPPDAAPTDVTLDNVCAKVADAYCTASFGACCSARGLGWNEKGCRAVVTTACAARVAAVKAGTSTFRPSALLPCQNAWSTMAARCALPALDFIKNYQFCAQLFVGTTAPGGSCSDDAQCKVGPGSFPDCDTSGRCQSISVADKDQPCSFSGSTRAYCDYGLACQPSSGSTWTCKAAKPEGSSCSYSVECGLGFSCDRSFGSGRCVKGQPAGTSCYNDDQCASWGCASGRCTDPNASPASAALCGATVG